MVFFLYFEVQLCSCLVRMNTLHGTPRLSMGFRLLSFRTHEERTSILLLSTVLRCATHNRQRTDKMFPDRFLPPAVCPNWPTGHDIDGMQ
jgi:hypothetical protein